MPGLFQDDDYSLAQRGASNASVGGSPTGPVAQPTQQTQDPISTARAEALKNYTNRGFIQKYLAPRVGATGNPDLNTIQAIDQSRANDQAVQTSKLNTIGGVNRLMQQLSLAPDEQKPFLAKMFSGPLSQIISGMAEPGHPTDHMTPELLEHLINSGTAGTYSQYHMIFGPNELNQLKRAQLMGAKPEEMDKLGITMGQQLLAPYKNMIPNNLTAAVGVAKQRNNVPANQEYKEIDFRNHLQQLIPEWVKSDPQLAQDPKAGLKMAVAVDEWLKDEKNNSTLADAGVTPGSIALERMKQGASLSPVAVAGRSMIAEGWDPSSPGFAVELRKRTEKTIPVAPGGSVVSQTRMAGSPAPGTAPQSDAGSQVPLATRMPIPAEGAIEKQTDLTSYTADLGRLIGLLNDPEIKAIRTGNDLANRSKRAGYQALITAHKNDPTHMLETQTPLPAKLAQVNYLATQLLTRYEKNEGGVRAVSGPYIQGRMSQLHGGSVFNPNIDIALQELYEQNHAIIKQRQQAATAGGQVPMQSAPDTAPPSTLPLPSSTTPIKAAKDPSAKELAKGPKPVKPTHRINPMTFEIEPIK